MNATKNLRAENIAICTDKNVETLDYIQEDFIFGMSDALRSPRNHITGSRGYHDISQRLFLTLLFLLLFKHLVCFGLDILLQNLDLSDLGVAMVHHFIEKLVCNDEVVSQRLILKFAKVGRQHLFHAIEE